MTTTPRAAAIAASALALAFFLTGCLGGTPAATSTPDATPAPTAAPTPTAEPVDPLTTVVALVARPDRLELRADDGTVVTTLDYLSSPVEAMAALTTVFGEPPVDEEYDGSNHYPPSTAHRWDAFELWELRYVDRWEGVVDVSLVHPNFVVGFTGPEALGVDLATADGRHVGDPWGDLLDAPGVMTNPTECSGPYLEFVELQGENPDGTPAVLKISVEFRPSDDDSGVARIGAPVPVQDSCA
ncbi:MAG: hypothetical protein K0S05_3408 [Agromyces sp.]|nr:hypothetical protein [Agromyces sp.]